MALAAAAFVFFGLAVGAGCGSGDGGGGDPFAGDPREAVVEGLAAKGEGPTLSWDEYDGAVLYSITSARDDGTGVPWFWVGDETEVEFGVALLPTLEEGAEPVDFAREFLEDEGAVAAERGAKYRWTVTALDEQGRPIGSSEVATFTCQDPCGG